MKATKSLLTAAMAILLAGALCSCVGRVGIEPGEGIIFDNVDGTMYVDKDFMKDFDAAKLANYRKFQTHRVVIPAPFTFGALSFGWGDISTAKIMAEGKFNKLLYAHYRRLSVATVYTNYEITAYGE